jgi:S1-C subfamily serine protease
MLGVRAKLTMGNGVVVRHGEHYDFAEYHPLQRVLYPVVSTVDPGDHDPARTFRVGPRTLYGMGTAVCIGAGWFITAKHVVEPVDKVNATTGDELMFVVLETDTALPSAHNDVYGGMLQVRGYDMHADTDLATLTAELPASGAHEIRTLDLSLRMPSVGEPVAASGYPVMRVDGNLPDAGPAAVGWERTLRASVGAVTEQNPDREGGWYRPGPGFVTDAPTFPGMSGGPVLDATNAVIGFVSSSLSPSDGSAWTSHVALLGPALELTVLDLHTGTKVDAATAPARQVAELVMAGAVNCEMDESCDVDPVTRKVVYTRP